MIFGYWFVKKVEIVGMVEIVDKKTRIKSSQTAYFDIGKVPDELKTDILDYVVENP